MTRLDEIKKKMLELEEETPNWKDTTVYVAGFLDGAMWADAHPHWISVGEEELPKEHEWILGYSLKREYIDVYNFDSNGLIEAHGITHWMHLSPPPIITSSKKGD